MVEVLKVTAHFQAAVKEQLNLKMMALRLRRRSGPFSLWVLGFVLRSQNVTRLKIAVIGIVDISYGGEYYFLL
jgi:hypothetical protein